MRPSEPYIQTFSGTNFTFLTPKSLDISINDIAHSLSMQCRFNGHTRKFYSVAEHCINASRLVPNEFKLEALLHDASEAYITDIATPVKRMLPDYQQLERVVQGAITEHFRLPNEVSLTVQHADKACLVTEARNLLPTDEDHWIHDEVYQVPLKLDDKYIMCLAPEYIEKVFLLRYEQYKNGIFKNVT